MNHIDEGTIHAWLDGALSAEQSRALEAHVAQCVTCSATVAEARGLIAGASRILTALDDIPADVTPKRAFPPTARVVRRQWRAARWVTGIAAALMVGIGITQWDRVRDTMLRQDLTSSAAERSGPAADTAQPTALSSVAVEAPAQRPQTVSSGDRRSTAAEQRAKAAPAGPTSHEFAAALQKSPGVADRQAREGGGRATTEPKRVVAAAAKSEAAAPSPLVDSVVVDSARARTLRRLASQDVQLGEVVVTAAPPQRMTVLDEAAEVARLAGCYSIRSAVEQQTTRMDVARRAVGAVAGAAAPAAPARDRASFADFTPPAAIRLDTVRTTRGYAVRGQASDSTIGSWQRIEGDSARVDLLMRGVFTFARTARTNCPER